MVQRPEDYRWSCTKAYLGLPGSPLPVNPVPVLALLHRDIARARREFVQILKTEAARPKRNKGNRLTALAIQEDQLEIFRAFVAEARKARARRLGESGR